jgi:dCMP deaminase
MEDIRLVTRYVSNSNEFSFNDYDYDMINNYRIPFYIKNIAGLHRVGTIYRYSKDMLTICTVEKIEKFFRENNPTVYIDRNKTSGMIYFYTESNWIFKVNIDEIDTSIYKNHVMTKALSKALSNAYISWDQYYMSIAQLVKSRSKDPVTQVGACIIMNNRVISTGYNGFPTGLSNLDFPWTKGNKDDTKNKYYYVVHAEMNAIFNYGGSIKDFRNSTLYVTFLPCPHCAKHMVQAGVKDVVYLAENNSNIPAKLSTAISKFILKKCNINYRKYDYEKDDNLKSIIFKMNSDNEKDFSSIEKCKKYIKKK